MLQNIKDFDLQDFWGPKKVLKTYTFYMGL